MNRGYIKLWRCIDDSDFWQDKPFDRARAWIDLIKLARHNNGVTWVRGIEVQLERGQVAWSEVSLSKRWGWSRGKVERFLKVLKMKQQIEQQNSNVTSVITIKNYHLYQGDGQQNEQQVVQQTGSKQDTKKNNKNEKHYNNPPTPPLSWDEMRGNGTTRQVLDAALGKLCMNHFADQPDDYRAHLHALDALLSDKTPQQINAALRKLFEWDGFKKITHLATFTNYLSTRL